MRRAGSELGLQDRIFAALGAEPGLIMLRNAVGQVDYFNAEGERRRVSYGLGVGTPDVVCLLTFEREGKALAVWLALELKKPDGTGEADPEQLRVHAIWRAAGAFVYIVESVDEARKAVEDARIRVRLEYGLAARLKHPPRGGVIGMGGGGQ